MNKDIQNFIKTIPTPTFDEIFADSLKPSNPMAETIATMNKQIQMKIEPIGYEDSHFYKMANDISKRFEPQISAVTSMAEDSKSIAESAQEQADSLASVAKSAEAQADIAIKKANSADIKGWIGTITSVLSLIVSIIALVLSCI